MAHPQASNMGFNPFQTPSHLQNLKHASYMCLRFHFKVRDREVCLINYSNFISNQDKFTNTFISITDHNNLSNVTHNIYLHPFLKVSKNLAYHTIAKAKLVSYTSLTIDFNTYGRALPLNLPIKEKKKHLRM